MIFVVLPIRTFGLVRAIGVRAWRGRCGSVKPTQLSVSPSCFQRALPHSYFSAAGCCPALVGCIVTAVLLFIAVPAVLQRTAGAEQLVVANAVRGLPLASPSPTARALAWACDFKPGFESVDVASRGKTVHATAHQHNHSAQNHTPVSRAAHTTTTLGRADENDGHRAPGEHRDSESENHTLLLEMVSLERAELYREWDRTTIPPRFYGTGNRRIRQRAFADTIKYFSQLSTRNRALLMRNAAAHTRMLQEEDPNSSTAAVIDIMVSLIRLFLQEGPRNVPAWTRQMQSRYRRSQVVRRLDIVRLFGLVRINFDELVAEARRETTTPYQPRFYFTSLVFPPTNIDDVLETPEAFLTEHHAQITSAGIPHSVKLRMISRDMMPDSKATSFLRGRYGGDASFRNITSGRSDSPRTSNEFLARMTAWLLYELVKLVDIRDAADRDGREDARRGFEQLLVAQQLSRQITRRLRDALRVLIPFFNGEWRWDVGVSLNDSAWV